MLSPLYMNSILSLWYANINPIGFMQPNDNIYAQEGNLNSFSLRKFIICWQNIVIRDFKLFYEIISRNKFNKMKDKSLRGLINNYSVTISKKKT